MINKVIEVAGIFCPRCGSDDTLFDNQSLEDGDDQYSIYKEHRTCQKCGKEFTLITEWKLQGFTFYDEDGNLEDIDYEIEK